MPFSQIPSFKPYISEALNIERQLVHQGSDGGVVQKKSGRETKLRLQKWQASTPCLHLSSHDQSKAQARRDPHARGKSMGTTAAAPSSARAQPPRPLNTGRRERAEGNGEKPKTLTGCLRGGAKPTTRLWRCRALWATGGSLLRAGVWTQCVGIRRGCRRTGLGLCPHPFP